MVHWHTLYRIVNTIMLIFQTRYSKAPRLPQNMQLRGHFIMQNRCMETIFEIT